MKIAALASDEIEKELRAKLIGAEIELLILKNIDDFLRVDGMDAYFDLEFEMNKERIDMLTKFLPKPVFVNSVANSLDEIGYPFIRINAWPTFLKTEICELALQKDASSDIVKTFMNAIQWQYRLVPDKPGMISARIIAMIINEAYYTAEENVSTKQEIDIAMQLGTNYPYGPFEWSEKIGKANILQLLEALKKSDDRYTISSMLKNEVIELLNRK
jgi:3-hydroxybutyryl-CoA dehydrogenase